MRNSRLEWKVGLFVLIGLVLLGALLLQFSKGLNFFRPTYTIYLHAPTVGGLKVKASVLMSGVQVGNVAAINLAPDGKSVSIALEIYSKYVIHRDARFLIEQSGFLGDQYVAIIPTQNTGEILRNGDLAEAEAPFDLQEVARSASGFVQRVDQTVAELNQVIAQVRSLFLNPETLGNLSTSIANLRQASERAMVAMDTINTVVATNAGPLNASARNLEVFSRQMNSLANDLGGVIHTNSPELAVAVKNIESASAMLKDVMADLQAGKGLAGNLLRNERLANDVTALANNLSITSSNLNRLGLWGILWRRKTPSPPPSTAEPLAAPKYE